MPIESKAYAGNVLSLIDVDTFKLILTQLEHEERLELAHMWLDVKPIKEIKRYTR